MRGVRFEAGDGRGDEGEEPFVAGPGYDVWWWFVCVSGRCIASGVRILLTTEMDVEFFVDLDEGLQEGQLIG